MNMFISMKKITLTLCSILLLSAMALSQNKINRDSIFKKKFEAKIYTKKPAQAVFAEAGGNSIIWSLNYDRRFNNRLDGFGFRAGVGYFPLGGSNLLTVPLGINYLIGDKGHFAEIGANISFVNSSNKNKSFPIESKFGQLDFTLDKVRMVYGFALGYRYQKPDVKGFHFRAGIEPILGDRIDGKLVFAITGHLSVGYSF